METCRGRRFFRSFGSCRARWRPSTWGSPKLRPAAITGRQRQADGERHRDHGGRPASPGHQPCASISSPFERARVECRRRDRGAPRGRHSRPQRPRRVGSHGHRNRPGRRDVETVNPANANEVLWNGRWEPLRVISEEVGVKGAAPSPRTEVQPSWSDLFRGPRTSSRVCAAVAVAGARHGRVHRRFAARPGELRA